MPSSRVRTPLWLAAVVLFVSCRAPVVPDRRPIESGLVSAQPVVMGPDPRWHDSGPEGSLRLRAWGRLWFFLRDGVEAPLRIRFAANEDSRTSALGLTWDGRAVGPERHSLTAPLVVEIPAEWLEPGRHRLEARSIPAGTPIGFSEISVVSGSNRIVLDESSVAELGLLGEFLEMGGAGADRVKHRGLLFVGPGERLADVGECRRCRLEVLVENRSPEEAEFSVARGSARRSAVVGPHDEQRLELELPRGTTALSFRVEGREDGLFFWKQPRWVVPGEQRTPIILLTMDTTRRDVLSPYGADRELTPAIDRFAQSATVFDAAYSTAPWTLPAHASMFTGLFGSQHGAGVDDSALSDEFETLAQRLREEGYFTAGFAGGYLISYRFGVGRGFDVYRDPDGFETRGDRLTEYLLEFLADYGSTPFFLFANYFDPHGRYSPPAEQAARFELDRLAAALPADSVVRQFADGADGAWREVMSSTRHLDEQERGYLEAAYRAEVATMDGYLGELFERLRSLQLYDRALIVLVADHGELIAEDGWFMGHGFRLDDGLVHVPLLVKWPGQRESERVDKLVSVADLFPTLLNVARGEGPSTEPGDRAPRSRDLRSAPRPGWILAEEHNLSVHPLVGPRLLAKHLYRVQTEAASRVVWLEGQVCRRKESGVWIETDCSGDGAEFLEGLKRVLLAEPSETGSSVVDPHEAEALEALGYL